MSITATRTEDALGKGGDQGSRIFPGVISGLTANEKRMHGRQTEGAVVLVTGASSGIGGRRPPGPGAQGAKVAPGRPAR